MKDIQMENKTLAVVNVGKLVSGDLKKPVLDADTIICKNGLISSIGKKLDVSESDVIIDAKNTTIIPGLIDSHCHIVLGDYTPRQKQIDFLDSYVHGGITSVVSAGEGVHAPGRPHDPVGAKALAITAFKCFQNFQPNGMKVNAGSVILEPGLIEKDFAEPLGRKPKRRRPHRHEHRAGLIRPPVSAARSDSKPRPERERQKSTVASVPVHVQTLLTGRRQSTDKTIPYRSRP